MRKKMIWASVLSMAMLLTACGEKTGDTSTPSDTKATTAATEAAMEATTEAETEATTEAETEAAVSEGDEVAQVQAVIDGYIKAVREQDYANMVKYYNMELSHYMSTGEKASEAELAEMLKEEYATHTGVSDENATIGAPVCAPELIQEYNDFLASDMFKEITNDAGETVQLNLPENYKIDGVYVFNYSSAGGSIKMDMEVLRVNGEWKVDSALSMAMMFSSMFEDMSEAE